MNDEEHVKGEGSIPGRVTYHSHGELYIKSDLTGFILVFEDDDIERIIPIEEGS